MKYPDKRELQRITINHSSDVEDFMNLYRKCTAKPLSFLVNNPGLTSDNPLHFRCYHLERIGKVIMVIDDKIRDEKLQYHIIVKEAAKILALLSGRSDIFR